MSAVTVSGGPFEDGLGNTLTGLWQFQPPVVLNFASDDEPHEQHGNLKIPGGTFSVSLAEGTYTFRLRTEVQRITQTVTISSANGTAQTIESLL